MRILGLLALLIGLLSTEAAAQSSVYICVGPPGIGACQPVSATNPLPTTPSGGTGIAAASSTVTTPSVPTPGTFVAVLAANTSRKACAVTNIGTTQGYCNAIAQASATTSNTMPVNANGGQFICASTSGPPASNVISCTCASGTCSFVVNEQ